jgi:hypothetical protein
MPRDTYGKPGQRVMLRLAFGFKYKKNTPVPSASGGLKSCSLNTRTNSKLSVGNIPRQPALLQMLFRFLPVFRR